MNKAIKKIGLFGGTFDPIHLGHLHVAHTVQQLAVLEHIQFIPAKTPPHRPAPVGSATDRLAMLQLALRDEPLFSVNTIELTRAGPSYTIDTLCALAHPEHALYFIMAIDNFLQLTTWHKWQEILNYCHLIIVNRPGSDAEIPTNLQEFYASHHVENSVACQNSRHGNIIRLTIKPSAISATEIRHKITEKSFMANAVPASVYAYIQEKKLYGF